MLFNRIMFASGCVVAWFVVLAFLCVFALALVLQALMGELGDHLFGAEKTMDLTSARKVANRMCIGTRSP
jgi:hypothetical protein